MQQIDLMSQTQLLYIKKYIAHSLKMAIYSEQRSVYKRSQRVHRISSADKRIETIDALYSWRPTSPCHLFG